MFKKKDKNRINTDGTMQWRKKTSLNGRNASLRKSMMNVRSTVLTRENADFIAACELPEDFEAHSQDDINSWLAENAVEFFNEAYLNYQMAVENNVEWDELCHNPKNHANKGYPPGVMYLWRDDSTTKPQQLPADEYVNKIFMWIENVISDEDIFPPEEEIPFPHDFKKYLRKMFTRLFRAYVIIRANECLRENVDRAQLTGSMRFFLYFGWYWELLELEDKKEAKSIAKILDPIREKYLAEIGKKRTPKDKADVTSASE